eukprot:Sspe_Gene.25295::Locus_10151_Transcript_1_1_Confidence_1.000_Length_5227::g.25295::m.25295
MTADEVGSSQSSDRGLSLSPAPTCHELATHPMAPVELIISPSSPLEYSAEDSSTTPTVIPGIRRVESIASNASDKASGKEGIRQATDVLRRFDQLKDPSRTWLRTSSRIGAEESTKLVKDSNIRVVEIRNIGFRGGAAAAASIAALPTYRLLVGGVDEKLSYNGREHSLCIFSGDHPLRMAIFRLICSRAFQRGIMVVILLNALVLALDTPGLRDEDGVEGMVKYTELIFLAIYSIEVLLKVVALGLVMHEHSYLRNPVNAMDIAVVVAGFVSLAGYSDVNSIAMMRLIRPARMISRVPGMKVLVLALMRSARGLSDVVCLLCFVLLLFAILGVYLFAGVMHQRCYYHIMVDGVPQLRLVLNDTLPCSMTSNGRQCSSNGFTPPQMGDPRLPHNGSQVCDVHLAMFDNFPLNFDTSYRAALVVFKIMSLDDWPFFVHQVQSAVGWWYGLYFVAVTLVGTYFCITLFLAVLAEMYSEAKEEVEKQEKTHARLVGTRAWDVLKERWRHAKATEEDRRKKTKPLLYRGAIRAWHLLFEVFCGVPCLIAHLHETTRSGRVLSYVMFAATIFNILVLATDHYGAPETMERFIQWTNLVCSALFIVEAAVKLVGLGVHHYFFHVPEAEIGTVERRKSPPVAKTNINWYNVFDFILAVCSVPEVAYRGGNSFIAIFRIFRAFRLVRVLHTILGSSFTQLITAVLNSVSAVAYVAVACFLFIFIYGVMGIRLFEKGFPSRSQRQNFNSLHEALLTVFISITGDSWTQTMIDSQKGTGKDWSPFLYFISLLVIGQYCILNLFVAIIVNNFAQSSEVYEVTSDELSISATNVGQLAARFSAFEGAQSVSEVHGLSSFLTHQSDSPLQRLLKHRTTKFLRLAVIVIFDLVALSIERPTLDEDSETQYWLDVCQYVSTGIYTVEALLRCVAYGVFRSQNSLLRHSPVEVIALVVGGWGGTAYRFLRPARALRALELIVISTITRILMESLVDALRNIIEVLFLCIFLWLVFAILAVQLYKGAFYVCDDPTVDTREECEGEWSTWRTNAFGSYKVAVNRTWSLLPYSFDHTPRAMWTLFQMATADSWSQVMFSGIDARGDGLNPKRNAHPEMLLFFVIFMLVGGIFAVNLFIGVLSSVFQESKESRIREKAGLITSDQMQWVDMALTVHGRRIPPAMHFPKPLPWECALLTKWRRRCFNLVQCTQFEWFITVVIILNTTLMLFVHYNQPGWLDNLMYVAHLVFVTIYAIEALIKIAACGISLYMRFRWHRFEFVLVVLGLLSTFFPALPILNVLQTLRIARLSNRVKGLERLFTTVISAFPILGRVMLLLVVVCYIFAVVGVQMFGEITLEGNTFLNENTNFGSVRMAMLTLYEVSTLVRWRSVKDGCTITPDNSGCSYDRGDCGTVLAIPYFAVFMAVVPFTLLNLFITVVLEQFSQTNDSERAFNLMLLEDFQKLWHHFDPGGRGSMEAGQFMIFLRILMLQRDGPWAKALERLAREHEESPLCKEVTVLPLGGRPAGVPWKGTALLRVVRFLNIPVRRDWRKRTYNRISYTDAISSLTRALMGIDLDVALRLKDLVPGRFYPEQEEGRLFLCQWCAARCIRSNIRKYRRCSVRTT